MSIVPEQKEYAHIATIIAFGEGAGLDMDLEQYF